MGNSFLQGWRQIRKTKRIYLGAVPFACTLTLHSCSVADKSSKLTLLRQLVQANSCSVADVAIAHTTRPNLGFCVGLVNLGSTEAVLIYLNQINVKGERTSRGPAIVRLHSGGDSSN